MLHHIFREAERFFSYKYKHKMRIKMRARGGEKRMK